MKNRILKQICLIILVSIIGLALPANAGRFWPLLPTAIAKKDTYNLSESRILLRILSYVQKNYVEPKRIRPKEMFKSSLSEIQKSAPEILVRFESSQSCTITIDKAVKRFSASLSNINSLQKVIEEIFAFIQLHYNGDTKLSDIEAMGLQGLLNTLDPHSSFLPPEIYKEFKIDTRGEFGGLGIVITTKDGQLTIIAPIEDTPAWKAGLRTNDVIIQIGEESTINMPLTKAVSKLRGKVGTRVTITVEREGRAAPFEVTLTRAKIQIDSIKSTIIKDKQKVIGYIKIKRFQKDSDYEFFKSLKLMQANSGKNFVGLIMDLRNNPGGLLNQAVAIADGFVDEGVIVSTVGARKRFIEEERAHLRGTEPKDYPIIILVNEGSASASEIVAGALQAHNRAIVMGQKTFGKGSVQSVYDLGGNSALKLTIAQYLTAGKYSIQTMGIVPDITLIPMTVEKDHMDLIPNKPRSEMELEKHLEQVVPTTGKKTKEVRFSKAYLGEEELETLQHREYTKKIDFKDDFAVELAKEIIASASSTKPEAIVAESKSIFDRFRQKEERNIAANLKGLGIDWKAGKAHGNVRLSIKSGLEKEGKPIPNAIAGEKLGLNLEVKNIGTRALYRLVGVSESVNPFFQETEFLFGTLMPGKSASRKTPIKLPASITSQNVPLTVTFYEDNIELSDKFDTTLKVKALPTPHYTFTYQLEKPLSVAQSTPLPKGKSVPLAIRIKNIGEGPSKDSSIFITNKKDTPGVFIEKGRIELGEIKPGEIKKATLIFHVQPTISTSTFILEMSIYDRKLLQILVTDLEFTIESGAISPPPGIWYQGPQIGLAESTLPIITGSSQYILKGEITDNSQVKDHFIFVEEDKVHYKSNPNQTAKTKFTAKVPVKDGNNNITIIARDENNLATKKRLVIEKK